LRGALPHSSTVIPSRTAQRSYPPAHLNGPETIEKKKNIKESKIEEWRQVWEGGTTPKHTKEERKKVTAARRSTRKKKEEIRKEEKKSSSFLSTWMKSFPDSHSKHKEEYNNHSEKKSPDKESINKNEKKNLTMKEKIKLFEPEEEPKKKKPRKFNDDKSWIGIGPKLGCDKKKDCSRNGTESKESQETGKKLGKEEGSNPKQPLGLWDERGE